MNDKMLNTLLQTPEVYRRIISKIISNSYISDDIALINNLNDYIINNNVEEKYLKEYITFLYDLYKVDNKIMFKFNIFKHEELFSASQNIVIKDGKYKIIEKINKLSLKLINNEEISNKDMCLVLDFFNFNIDNPKYKKYCDNIYKYLLNNYQELYMPYIINYTSKIVCDLYNLPYIKIYYSNDGINNELTINDKNNIKYINKLTNNIYSIVKIIKEQNNNYNLLDRFESSKDIIFKNNLNIDEYKEYSSIYKNKESITYYDINTWQVTINILHKYSLTLYNELNNIKKDSLTKYYYKTLYITSNKVVDKAKYNVDKLDQIMLNNPSLLMKYPILNALYTNNGHKRNILDILVNEHNLNEKCLFNDYITEYIQTGKLKKIDINKISIEQQALLVNKILILTKIELSELLNNFKLYKLLDKEDMKCIDRKEEYDRYNFNRVNKIRYYINYLNDNEKLIKHLATDYLDNDYKINKNIKEVIKYLKEIKTNINDTYSKDIIKLKEVTLYGE